MLGGVRQERSNILLVSNGWYLAREAQRLFADYIPRNPTIGVGDTGKLTMGARRPGAVDTRFCDTELQRLSSIDFQRRHRDLIRQAVEANVTFYALRPIGLAAAASTAEMRGDTASVSSLVELSQNTDGVAMVNTNELAAGARKIADDLTAAYILGYYSTNTKTDGRIRKITVRLKGSSESVRARREYRAATQAEVTEMRNVAAASAAAVRAPASPVDTALAELKRLRPDAVLNTHGVVLRDDLVLTTEIAAIHIEAGRWKTGGEVQVILSTSSGDILKTVRATLDPSTRAAVIRMPLSGAPGPFVAAVRLRNDADGEATDRVTVTRSTGRFGEPMLFRLPLPNVVRPAASPQFRRTERIQVRWPLLTPVKEPGARVLGRDGKPIDLVVTLTQREEAGIPMLVADLNLAPLTAGDYVIEVRGGDAAAHLAIRIKR